MKIKKHFAIVFFTTAMSLSGISIDVVAGGNQLTCQEHTMAVTTAPDETTQYNVVGWLCAKGSFANKTVQVLLSGATYGHVYWDFPYQPQRYSYVRALTNAGYATFNMDRLGIGISDHPHSDEVTLFSNAFVTHQIIQALRAGEIGGVAFEHVIVVGHSLGATISLALATRHPDGIDGVIIAGYAHRNAIVDGFFESIYSANLDPCFEDLNLDDNYVTTKPGKRGKFFYHAPTADQNVIALDEATKETLSLAEVDLDFLRSNASLLINVPVLMINGQFDVFACSGNTGCNEADFFEDEKDFFSPEACLEVAIVPQSGHDINLQRNAPAAFTMMRRWADKYVGVDGGNVGVCN